MITITHLFYTRFTHSSLNNIFYTTINNIIILFKNFLPLRFFLLFKYISLGLWGFPSGSEVKNPSAMQKPQETWVRSLGQKIPQRREWHPTPGDLPNPGIKPRSPALQADALISEPPGKPKRKGGNLISFPPVMSQGHLLTHLYFPD